MSNAGRNDPCPCRSGRKFKKCCGAPAIGSARGAGTETITITASGQITPQGREIFAYLAQDRNFLQLIGEIDDDLREEGVPIPDRPAAAIRAAGLALGEQLREKVPDREPRPGMYSGDDLVLRIRRWYQEHYGGALGPAMRITSEAEFLRQMERIDQELKERDIPMPGRPLAALGKMCELLKVELRLTEPDHEPVPGKYTGDDLSMHIDRWYMQRYGDRLNINNVDGRVVVLLRGDPWVVELPVIYGGGRGPVWVCEYDRPTTLPSKPQVYRLGDPTPPRSEYNVLDCIVALSDGLAKSLTSEERERVLDTFGLGRSTFNALRRPRREGLLALVRGDLEAAVSHLSGQPHQAGLSKWASLQAAEKALKAYIKAKQMKFKFSHKLAGLAKDAAALGLSGVDTAWIDAVQCGAGVRYGEKSVSLEEAVAAHHGSLRVVAHVLNAIPKPSSAK